MDPISEALGQHYGKMFSSHGPCSAGVDWGTDERKMLLRYDKMLAIADFTKKDPVSVLDVGCGFGGLLTHTTARRLNLNYTGIDLASNMIEWAKANSSSGRFIHGDIFTHQFDGQFDYVVCSGILTQKLDTPALEMDVFAARLVRRMYGLCKIGMAFNVMTTRVNYYAKNLYYRNPAEMLAWCQMEITPHIKLDHAYPLYEYTMYLYHDNAG